MSTVGADDGFTLAAATDIPLFPLLSDEPAKEDLLGFTAVAESVLEALRNTDLDPVVLGISGSWGSGKSTILELIEAALCRASTKDNRKVDTGRIVVVRSQPWKYDPTFGVKETLITEILGALEAVYKAEETTGARASKHLQSLLERVNWSKALRLAVKSGMAMQLPNPDALLDLVKPKKDSTVPTANGMEAFRTDLETWLKSAELSGVSKVVVLVDDLDRCLPETVVETLEAIRLFLSTEKMSFVIAADEARVADAIHRHLRDSGPIGEDAESPAELYLHKIVQTTFPTPGLSRYDTYSYLLLQLLLPRLNSHQFGKIRAHLDAARSSGVDAVEDLPDISVNIGQQIEAAQRLTGVLYEKFHGNPRRIKRFINDLSVRISVARRRGIELSPPAVAKLMVLERLFKPDFATVIGWLGTGTLRDRMEALQESTRVLAPSGEAAAPKPGAGRPSPPPVVSTASAEESFSPGLLRWVRLEPELNDVDVAGYLYLAAAFNGLEVSNDQIPEHLRDIFSDLIDSTQSIARRGRDACSTLGPADLGKLVELLGRQLRDQPRRQRQVVHALISIADRGYAQAEVNAALRMLRPPGVGAVSLFQGLNDVRPYKEVLESWASSTEDATVREAIAAVLEGVSSGNQQ